MKIHILKYIYMDIIYFVRKKCFSWDIFVIYKIFMIIMNDMFVFLYILKKYHEQIIKVKIYENIILRNDHSYNTL